MQRVQLILAIMIAFSFAGSLWSWMESTKLDELSQFWEQAARRQETAKDQLIKDNARSRVALTESQLAKIREDISFANGLADKRQFSWTLLLHNLDQVIPPNVSIASIRLSFQDSTITLSGKVSSLRDLMQLAENLEAHEAFNRVRITEHSGQSLNDAKEIVRPQTSRPGMSQPTEIAFALAAQYKTIN